MRSEIDELIPCTTSHVCIFEDGKKYEVIGWATKKRQKKKIEGDIERVSEVSALITIEDEVCFADEKDGFIEYVNLSLEDIENCNYQTPEGAIDAGNNGLSAI